MAYSEKVMDHFEHPRNLGKMDDADGIGEVGNAKCGDIMKVYLKVNDGVISDVKFNTFGCASAIATSSMATEMIKGQKVEDALKLSNKAVVEALDGLPPAKIHCSVLAEEAVKAAVADYYKKNGIELDPEIFGSCSGGCSRFWRKMMSEVTSVLAFLAKALLGKRIAPNRSARCARYSRTARSFLSNVPLEVMKATMPPGCTLSRDFAKK